MIHHEHVLRVYYEDTDAGGVVYHARYLAFAERARTEALRAAGLPHARMLAEHGVIFMVRRANLEYFRPARLDDRLVVATETLATTGATVSLRQSFRRDDTPIASLVVLLACVRAVVGTAARIPPDWRVALV